MRLLVTLSGGDCAAAVLLIETLREVSRFREGDHLASYLGLPAPVDTVCGGFVAFIIDTIANHEGPRPLIDEAILLDSQ